jgi:hypothetical protein
MRNASPSALAETSGSSSGHGAGFQKFCAAVGTHDTNELLAAIDEGDASVDLDIDIITVGEQACGGFLRASRSRRVGCVVRIRGIQPKHGVGHATTLAFEAGTFLRSTGRRLLPEMRIVGAR